LRPRCRIVSRGGSVAVVFVRNPAVATKTAFDVPASPDDDSPNDG
jgi:hypothetical protein